MSYSRFFGSVHASSIKFFRVFFLSQVSQPMKQIILRMKTDDSDGGNEDGDELIVTMRMMIIGGDSLLLSEL